MNRNWVWAGLATALVMGPWNFGTAGERPVVRAQGGAVYAQPQQVYYEGEFAEECEEPYCSPIAKICGCFTYITTLGGKQSGYRSGNRNGSASGNQYLYRYRAPQNLKYPPANQPAGVVVYPYYTVKGPDDFFLNETR